MPALAWIILSGVLMSCIALIGAASRLISQATLDEIRFPLLRLRLDQ